MNCNRIRRAACLLGLRLLLGGCAGAVIDTATDLAPAAARLPFKAGGAVVDVAGGDG